MELLRQMVSLLPDFEPSSKPVLVGLSGGMDSILLADLLSESGANVEAIHVNYGLRPESNEDEAFVRQWCDDRGIRIYVEKPAVSSVPEVGVQDWARTFRYNVFHRIASETGIHDVYVGHHADDQLETMILNLLRGTGYAGLSAMDEVRELMRGSGVYLYRPLLRVSRKDLAICADARNLKWVEDASNRDLRYARNAVRAELAQMAPADLDEFVASATELSTNLSHIRALIRSAVENATSLLIVDLKKLSPIIRRWILLEWISSHAPEVPRRKGIAQALNRLIDAQTGKKLDLGQWEVWKERAELTIRGVPANGVSRQTKTSLVASTTSKLPAHTEDDESAHVQDPVDLDFSKEDTVECVMGTLHYCIVAKPEHIVTESSNIAHLAIDDLSATFRLRPWRSGDRFIPLGSMGSRKVKRFLTDRRVPSHERKHVPVLEKDNTIAWVVGHRLDEQFRVQDHTRFVVQLTWTPRN